MFSKHELTANCSSGERKQFPFEITAVDPSIEKQLLKDFSGTWPHILLIDQSMWKYSNQLSADNIWHYMYIIGPRPVACN